MEKDPVMAKRPICARAAFPATESTKGTANRVTPPEGEAKFISQCSGDFQRGNMDPPIAILPQTESLRPRKRRAKMVMTLAAISSSPLEIEF